MSILIRRPPFSFFGLHVRISNERYLKYVYSCTKQAAILAQNAGYIEFAHLATVCYQNMSAIVYHDVMKKMEKEP